MTKKQVNKKRHKITILYFIAIPILVIIIFWFYSYFKWNIYDENFLRVLIDNLFLPFYAALFWTIFKFFLEQEDDSLSKIYKIQLTFIFFCVSLIITLKLIFIHYF
jgi:hypothetical protein